MLNLPITEGELTFLAKFVNCAPILLCGRIAHTAWFGEDKKALVYFVSSKGIFVHKYPFILRSNDWLVLEIKLNGQGKRFCGKERNTCKFILTL